MGTTFFFKSLNMLGLINDIMWHQSLRIEHIKDGHMAQPSFM